MLEGYAVFGDRVATGPRDLTADPACLDGRGFWAVVMTFEGAFTAVRFADVRRGARLTARGWSGPRRTAWTGSLDAAGYRAGVARIRAEIAAGNVYQVNLCRVLSAPLSPGTGLEGLAGLAGRLAQGNPAPHAAVIDVPAAGLQVASASPELFLRRTGHFVESAPIKGTAATVDGMLDKDRAENIMITDLVRNDLGQVCETGTVTVPKLLELQAHPGLFHLVSTVRGQLRDRVGWAGILAATFPPGSVSGAPKLSALKLIKKLEPVPRGPYCGAVGWVDADRGEGVLAVGIRTFWIAEQELHFGTGAGITWGSDPDAEWAETELKADRLLSLASQSRHLRPAPPPPPV